MVSAETLGAVYIYIYIQVSLHKRKIAGQFKEERSRKKEYSFIKRYRIQTYC